MSGSFGRTDFVCPVPLMPAGIEQYVHGPELCGDSLCPLHNPSSHHMAEWPINIRIDRPYSLAERICLDGVGHPDPDSLAFVERKFVETGRAQDAIYQGWHGCDGCCVETRQASVDLLAEAGKPAGFLDRLIGWLAR